MDYQNIISLLTLFNPNRQDEGRTYNMRIAKMRAHGSHCFNICKPAGHISGLPYLFSYVHIIRFFIFTQQRVAGWNSIPCTFCNIYPPAKYNDPFISSRFF
jgi:hypothetical protein